MNEWWDRWWQMAMIPRYGSLAAIASCLLFLLWIVWLRPQQQMLIAEQQSLNQLIHRLQQRQQQWHQNPDNAQLQTQLHAVQALLPLPGSSGQAVETVLATRHNQLEEWQPEGAARALTLHLPWQAFQSLFAEFAQAAAPFPSHFQLLAQPHYLEARLWLEPDDAS